MAAIPLGNMAAGWDATKRYTAGADDIGITFTNYGWRQLRWTTTTDDTVPVIPVLEAQILLPGQFRDLQLKAGERIWFAGEGASATMEV